MLCNIIVQIYSKSGFFVTKFCYEKLSLKLENDSLIHFRRRCLLTVLKLFKLTFQSYFKKMKKIYFYKKISLFNCADSYFSSHYHRLCSCCNSIRELKPNKQRWGRWWNKSHEILHNNKKGGDVYWLYWNNLNFLFNSI